MVNGAWLKSNFQFQVLKTTTVDLNMKAMVRTNHNTLVICNNKTLVTNNNNFNNKEDYNKDSNNNKDSKVAFK